jgi:hypothetical protein
MFHPNRVETAWQRRQLISGSSEQLKNQKRFLFRPGGLSIIVKLFEFYIVTESL